jgi:hypothetical protein
MNHDRYLVKLTSAMEAGQEVWVNRGMFLMICGVNTKFFPPEELENYNRQFPHSRSEVYMVGSNNMIVIRESPQEIVDIAFDEDWIP